MNVVDWAKKNRVWIAAMSVVGSFAGLVFSGLDLQTSILERKRKKLIAEKAKK